MSGQSNIISIYKPSVVLLIRNVILAAMQSRVVEHPKRWVFSGVVESIYY